MKKLLLLAGLAAMAVLTLSACGGQSAPASVEYTITMNEFAYEPNKIELKVGQQVTLHLVNQGALDHELMIGRDAMGDANTPNSFEHYMFEETAPMMSGTGYTVMGADGGMDTMDMGSGQDHEGFMVLMDGNNPEGKATLTFTVTPEMVGEWEMGCFVDSGAHYIAGMTGKIVVSP